jgi:hypothetical protein
VNNDNEEKSDKIANDEDYPVGPFVGALLVEPEPPKPGTFVLLLPENFTWGSKRRNGAIRITFREITKTPTPERAADVQEEG